MNTRLTPPPEGDLRPATRNRQRDELIAIVDHEFAQATPRRRFVPLAAAAAVVALAAGLAIGLPALGGDDAQPAVSGPGATPVRPAVEPLTEAEQRAYVQECHGPDKGIPKGADRKYTIKDGFKWVNPPADAATIAWVVLDYGGKHIACGIDAKGKHKDLAWGIRGDTEMAVVNLKDTGVGTYTKGVARITIASGSGPETEAVLRNGFFFAPMKYVDTVERPKPDSAPRETIRAYDAAGKVVYESAKTYREQQARLDACYTNPEGTKVVSVFGGRKGTPPVNQCRRGVAWNW
ncbi:hypothetical protein [Kribbella shirazensis]|uniref:Uncharacterized protein n=1 Tax=Kribbella shirazensis TaxID=1105143 RepID=A0A7X5V9S7_9ACTN|nr:hypothetical protein [Kribbella shirazensis]NIK56821.1 hypothetical protein [Kribbella shirazensis]